MVSLAIAVIKNERHLKGSLEWHYFFHLAILNHIICLIVKTEARINLIL
jgi:hypothetical protein